MAVARTGEEATPAQPAPPALRPFLQFARLPPRALVALRRVLDGDEEFRARVVEAVTEDGVGRAGWLYLSRPAGWDDELAALVGAAEAVEEEAEDRRAENEARRRLAGAEAAVRRAEEAAAGAHAEAARAVAALGDERRARREAADQATALDRRLSATMGERDRARRQASEAAAEAERLRSRVAALEGRVRELEEAPPSPPPPETGPVSTPDASLPAAVAVDVDAVAAARALAAAARAAVGLAESLSAAADALAPPPDAPLDTGPAPPSARRTRRPPPPPRRRPAPLPPGVLDDSPEAADHLARVPGVAVVVDGYNVSQTGWPGRPITEQRRRLVDALAELAARTGADVSVVFDGSDTAWPTAVPTTGRAVKVSFSPPGVEADDVVIERVAQLPASRPVVVASSDRRVQEGARASGANVISSPQLLAALHR